LPGFRLASPPLAEDPGPTPSREAEVVGEPVRDAHARAHAAPVGGAKRLPAGLAVRPREP